MNNIAYIINSRDGKPQSLSCVLDGRPVTVASSNPNFKDIIVELGKPTHDAVKLRRLMDVGESIREYSGTKIDVRRGRVYFRGKEVHNTLTRRIVEFMRADLPCDRLIRFFQNIQSNPNERSRNFLYNYCENFKIPITEDGCVLLYKTITNDYKDKWTGTIDNHPGKVVRMRRQDCNEDANKPCERSLHGGNWNYVCGYGSGDDRFVLIKMNPRDCVCVPHDSSFEKVRMCRYAVLQEVKRDEVVEFKTECAEQVSYYNVRDSKGHFTKEIQDRRAASRILRDKSGRFASKV